MVGISLPFWIWSLNTLLCIFTNALLLCSFIVEKIIALGSHDLFIAKVLNKLINDDIEDINIHQKLRPISYFRPNYYLLKLPTRQKAVKPENKGNHRNKK